MQVNPYLTFSGQCENAFKFYQQCLGGTMEAMMSHAGTPAEQHVPEEWRNMILHARLNVGGTLLMGSDAPADRFEKPQGFAVSLQIPDADEADRAFNALAENGTVTMPIQQTFWAKRFGMLTDQYGIPWIVNCE